MWMIFLPVVAVIYLAVLMVVVMVKFFVVLAYLSVPVVLWLCSLVGRGVTWGVQRVHHG